MTTTSRFTSVFASLLIACGGGAGVSNDPVQLVGTWRELPAAFQDTPIDQRFLATFGADGSFAVDPRGGQPVVNGTYNADDQTVTTTEPNEALTEPYIVTADRLMLGPLTPAGSVDDVVGSWHLELDERMGQTTAVDSFDLALHADATSLEVEHAPDGSTKTTEGMWTSSDAEVVIDSKANGITFHVHLQRLPGFDAIGGILFERID